MGVSGKFLFLFVAIILLQGICAWPYFNIWKWKNLDYEIKKASYDAEKDLRKDLLNVKNNIWKDANKLITKARGDKNVAMCTVDVQQKFLTEVDRISVESMDCIESIREKARTIEEDKEDLRKLNLMKNEMKSDIKNCRNTAKASFKKFQKTFPSEAANCLNPGKASYMEEDIDDSSSQ